MPDKPVAMCPLCGEMFADAAMRFCPNDGATLGTADGATLAAAGAPHETGARLVAGQYRLDHPLGSGATATVYAAHRVDDGAEVALKLLSSHAATDSRMAERFAREAAAMQRIRGEHAVVPHDFGQTPEGGFYLVMDRIHGETLADRLKRTGALPAPSALRIGAAVARALAQAHEAGVVHRDLKPANVILAAPDDHAMVVDFGVARVLQEAVAVDAVTRLKLTRPGSVLGSPIYVSPEAIESQPTGPPSDLYALGIVLYEMLLGHPPFDASTPMALFAQHLRQDPPLQDERLTEPLRALLKQLLAKSPWERPTSAREVAFRLEAMRGEHGERASRPSQRPRHHVSEMPAPPSEPPPSPVRPPRARVARRVATLGLLLLLFGAASLALWWWLRL